MRMIAWRQLYWLILSLHFCSGSTWAYEPITHSLLSVEALNRSVLVTSSTKLRSYGLKPGIAASGDRFPNSEAEAKMTIEALVSFGADWEDSRSIFQATRHFYNPVDGSKLLPSIGATSPDWALEDNGLKDGQLFSYRLMRRNMLRALTEERKTERDISWGMAFQTLGHVMHHIQDMAQPQHVRGDAHCDASYPCLVPGALFGFYGPSVYERRVEKSMPPYGNYPTVYSNNNSTIFTSARKFWATNPPGGQSSGKGIAEFTNRSFISAGSNFDKPNLFPSPRLNAELREEKSILELCLEPGAACSSQGLVGIVTFFGNQIEDSYIGENIVNTRMTTLSIFDKHLEKYGKAQLFSYNRFNADAAARILVPRAIGYSSGLVNYFFRGEVGLQKSASNGFLIRNNSPEEMRGVFELYYDDINDNRYRVSNASWTLTIPSGGTSAPVTFDAPLSPVPKRKHQYMLVFVGAMGEEVPQTGFVGAVGASLVRADPFPPAFSGWRYALQGPSGSGGDIVCAASLGDAVNQWNMKNANSLVKLVLDPASQLNQDATSLSVDASASVIDVCEGSMQASSRGVLYGSDAGLLGVKPMTNRQTLNGNGQVVAIGSGQQLVFYQTIDCPAGYRVTTEPFAVVTAAEVSEVLHPIISCQP